MDIDTSTVWTYYKYMMLIWRPTQTRHDGVDDVDSYITKNEPCVWLNRTKTGAWWALAYLINS